MVFQGLVETGRDVLVTRRIKVTEPDQQSRRDSWCKGSKLPEEGELITGQLRTDYNASPTNANFCKILEAGCLT
jgi:hypothetical protein